MRLSDRMEKAAASRALLRDTALKEQFVRGVREQSVCQELRRIVINSAGKPFFSMRDEALLLLRKHDEGCHSM